MNCVNIRMYGAKIKIKNYYICCVQRSDHSGNTVVDNNTKMDPKEMGWKIVDWIYVVQNWDPWQVVVCTTVNSLFL